MKKVLEKIFEDELFRKEKFEGTGFVTINNTSKDEKLNLEVSKNAEAETNDINVLVYNKNILKLDNKSQYGTTYHDMNRVTIKNSTHYLYATHNFDKIRNLVKGKNVTISIIANGTVENGSVAVEISSNKKGKFVNKFYNEAKNYENDIYTITHKFEEDEYFTLFDIYPYPEFVGTLELELQFEIGEKATNIVKHEEQIITVQDKQKLSALEYEDITHIACADELACDFNVSAKTSIVKKLVEQIKNISSVNEVGLESLEALHTHTHTRISQLKRYFCWKRGVVLCINLF